MRGRQLQDMTNKMEKPQGKVRALVAGLENMGKVQIKKLHWAKGTESPVPSHTSHTTRRVETKDAPAGTVPARLLMTSEEHARGLQKTNDRLHEDLVAAELRADAAERQRLDFEQRLLKAQEELELERLRPSRGGGLRRSDVVEMNAQNARALEASIKHIADAQLAYLRELISSNAIIDDDAP